MDDVQWPKQLNKVITKRWSQLKNTLVMKDLVDHLIQRRVVTLDYWMGLKSRPVSESERTEDFLSLVLKFDQQKFNHFLEALIIIDRQDLVKQLMRCQDIKQLSGKSRTSENSINKSRSYKSEQEFALTEFQGGQTDCDEPPQRPVTDSCLTKRTNNADGHNGSLESTKVKKRIETNKPPGFGNLKAEVKQVANKSTDRNITSQIMYNSNITKEIVEVKNNTDTRKTGKPLSKTKDIPKIPQTDDKQMIEEPIGTTDKLTNIPGVKLDPNTANENDLGSKTEELQRKEEQLLSKESELKERELKLQEQENNLKQKEAEILTRENSLLSNTTGCMETVIPVIHNTLEVDDPPTASTTQSTDIFADVREQLAAMKIYPEEIESERTTRFGFQKEDFVRHEDLNAVQQQVDGIHEELVTDRSQREILRQKVEDLKQEIENLQSQIKSIELGRQTDKSILDKEISRLKNELKNAKLCYNEAISKIKSDMKDKESECDKLNAIIETVKKDHIDMGKRVLRLENEKQSLEFKVLKFEKEISELNGILNNKETQMSGLRRELEDTESEKEDLIEEVGSLKTEIARLKADRKRLEQEKKTLLGRCVKPNWSNSSNRKTTFK